MTITQQQAVEALERVYYATHASFIDRNLVRQYIEQSTAQPQAVVPAPPQEFESAQGRALASAWGEGWAQCRDAEFIGEDAQDEAFNQSVTLAQCLHADQTRFQGGLSNDQLRRAWSAKVPNVIPTDEQLTAFALGIEAAAQPSAQAEQAPVVQAVQAGGAVLRKHVLLMLDGMGEQVNATPSTPSSMALQKGMRMAIGTAIDRVKSLPGAEESRTFMGEPVVSPRPIGFVVLNHFGPNKHLFSSFYDTRNSEHEWAPVFADRASSGATPADVRMLTGDEHEELESALGLAVYLSVARVIQQKFCAVNAGKRIPADGVIGGV